MRQLLLTGGPNPSAVLNDLLTTTFLSQLLPSQTQALVFDAAATLPGITLVPDAVDAAGRHGVAIAINNGDYRIEFIFNPTNQTYLGCNAFSPRTDGPNGYTYLAFALIATAIVDHARDRP
jgi:hypothetical protein